MVSPELTKTMPWLHPEEVATENKMKLSLGVAAASVLLASTPALAVADPGTTTHERGGAQPASGEVFGSQPKSPLSSEQRQNIQQAHSELRGRPLTVIKQGDYPRFHYITLASLTSEPLRLSDGEMVTKESRYIYRTPPHDMSHFLWQRFVVRIHSDKESLASQTLRLARPIFNQLENCLEGKSPEAAQEISKDIIPLVRRVADDHIHGLGQDSESPEVALLEARRNHRLQQRYDIRRANNMRSDVNEAIAKVNASPFTSCPQIPEWSGSGY